MDGFRQALALLGRLALAAIFLASAAAKLLDVSGTVARMTEAGVPAPEVLVWGAIAFLLVGGVALVLGWWTRLGAGLLIVFVCMATWYFHWPIGMPDGTEAEHAERKLQAIQALKNLAILGGLLMVVAHRPGSLSLDARRGRRS